MIRSLIELLRDPAVRLRLLLLVLSCTLAVALGWIVVTPSVASTLIKHTGYYYILGVFVAFLFFAGRVIRQRSSVCDGWIRRPGVVGLVLLVGTVFVVCADPLEHKILFDEYVLQSTAWHMHATKAIGTAFRAYDFEGTWAAIDAFVDKRPYFFAFLLSVLHDATGFRLANVFVLNIALTPVFLALVYWLGRTFTGRRGPALLAVGLLAALPLLAQQSTGAGMELHNLTMLALTMVLAVLYLRAPDNERLAALVLGAVLLSQSRYESVLFVVPVAVIVVFGWLRAKRVLLSWPVLIAPLLLLPYVWQSRVVTASPILWQLREGETSRFAWRYFEGNIAGAWNFFFNTKPMLANSWWLSALGCAGLVWAMYAAVRNRRHPFADWSPAAIAITGFGIGICANLGLLMFYYWSRLDEVIASRFALPMYLLFALVAAGLVNALDQRRWAATKFAAIGLGVWLLGWGMPAYATRLYTTLNLVMHELNWEKDVLAARRGPLLMVTNKSTIPFVLWRISAINPPIARLRQADIAWHMRERTFREVLVSQALRPTTIEGKLGIDPEDLLPDSYHLETVAEKRFGARWIRISRVVRIDATPQTPPGVSVPGPIAITTTTP